MFKELERVIESYIELVMKMNYPRHQSGVMQIKFNN